jgi:hypothetical protein
MAPKKPEAKLIKAPDKMIARRADTKARADFATWKMMAKLNGASSLPAEAQTCLAGYEALLEKVSEPEATEAAIRLLYNDYYAQMGGVGTPPDVLPRANGPAADNVTAFKRPPPRPVKPSASGPDTKPRLPVALIFAGLVVVYVGIRYFWP